MNTNNLFNCLYHDYYMMNDLYNIEKHTNIDCQNLEHILWLYLYKYGEDLDCETSVWQQIKHFSNAPFDDLRLYVVATGDPNYKLLTELTDEYQLLINRENNDLIFITTDDPTTIITNEMEMNQ